MSVKVLYGEYVRRERDELRIEVERLLSALRAIVADSGNAKRVDKLAREALNDRR